MPTAFNDLIYSAIKKYDLTIREVSAACGVSNSTVLRWLEGRSEAHPARQYNIFRLINRAGRKKYGTA